MSLLSALNVAVTSVNALNTGVRTISDNVANADNENYNRRKEQVTSLINGGVRITDIVRAANEGLQRDLLDQQSDADAAAVRNRLFNEIDKLTGTVNGDTPLANAFEDFHSAWKTYEASPDSDAAESDVVLAGRSIAQELGRLSDGLDRIEQQTLSEIDGKVQSLNEAIAEVDTLNNKIVRNRSLGRPTSSLENLRDEQIGKIASLVDISTFERSDGSISVYTKTGLDLTDRTPSTFSWDAATRSLTKSGSPSTDLVSSGQLPEGELSALIDFVRRDKAAIDNTDIGVGQVEKMRNQLDELAYSLVDDATRAATGDTTLAASDSLTSLSGVNAGDEFTIDVGGGAVTVPSGGGPLGAGIDASDTVQDLIDELNGIADVRARLTAHGKLEIATVNGTDLTLADTTGSPLQGLGVISGASQTFAARDPQTFANAYNGATQQAGEAGNFFEAEAGATPGDVLRNNLRVNETLSNGTEDLKQLAGNDVVAALNGTNRNMVGSGSKLENETYTGLASGVLTEITQRAKRADTVATQTGAIRDDLKQALRDEVGVDIDQEMARLTTLQNSYGATARVISSVNEMFQQLQSAVR